MPFLSAEILSQPYFLLHPFRNLITEKIVIPLLRFPIELLHKFSLNTLRAIMYVGIKRMN